MSTEPAHPVLRYLRKLAASPGLDALTDGQLLERFVTAQEEAAFRRWCGATGLSFSASAAACSAAAPTQRMPSVKTLLRESYRLVALKRMVAALDEQASVLGAVKQRRKRSRQTHKGADGEGRRKTGDRADQQA